MSVSVTFQAGLRAVPIVPADTSKNAILTGSDAVEKAVLSIRVVNPTGSAANFTAHFYNGTTEVTMYPTTSIAAGAVSVLDLSGTPLLGSSAEFRVTAGTADALHLILVYSERTRGAS